MTMGPQLAQWFVFCLVVFLFADCITTARWRFGAEMLRVSQIASTTAFLGYVMARWADAITVRRSIGTMIRSTIDGILYGLLTGGVFGWLWPQ
jgi:hypothetical protein